MRGKVVISIFLLIFSLTLMQGCEGKKAGIEGKVVDGKGNPMSSVKLIAKQVQPIKGYEHFETTTGSDGTFRFKGVFPSSDYIITPWSDSWKTAAMVKTQSGPEGQTSMLDKPLMVRFATSKDGVIKDSKTGLEWAPAPDQDMDWFQAANYANSLGLAGGGWRLPTRAELKGIYDESKEGGADPSFNIHGNWVWTGETDSPSFAWYIGFRGGREDTSVRGFVGYFDRVLPVRSGR
ncbi:MAG: DUF1566 domain-containing protein [Nitrospira sp.]|nr:DUF1566 domain-containing protein [Nitrospira sp.]